MNDQCSPAPSEKMPWDAILPEVGIVLLVIGLLALLIVGHDSPDVQERVFAAAIVRETVEFGKKNYQVQVRVAISRADKDEEIRAKIKFLVGSHFEWKDGFEVVSFKRQERPVDDPRLKVTMIGDLIMMRP